MSITVKANRLGYYKHKRRKEGDVFVIKNEKEFSKNWMTKVESDYEEESEDDYEEELPKAKTRGRPRMKEAVTESASNSEVI